MEMNKDQIIELLKSEVAAVINDDKNNIDEDENFMRLGISSVSALKIINSVRKKLEVEISPVALFEYKTLSEFAEYLANGGEDEWI